MPTASIPGKTVLHPFFAPTSQKRGRIPLLEVCFHYYFGNKLPKFFPCIATTSRQAPFATPALKQRALSGKAWPACSTHGPLWGQASVFLSEPHSRPYLTVISCCRYKIFPSSARPQQTDLSFTIWLLQVRIMIKSALFWGLMPGRGLQNGRRGASRRSISAKISFLTAAGPAGRRSLGP